MASTYSTSLRLELMTTGEKSGTWGTITNTNFGTLLEQAISGVQSVAMVDADLTLSISNGSVDEARNAVLLMTGALTATRNVVCPTVEKVYLVRNATSGAQSIVFKTLGGAGVTIANGNMVMVYCDGTDVLPGSIAFNPTTNTANVNVSGNITGNVTGAASLNVLKAGDVMTGSLDLSPAAANAALFLRKPTAGYDSVILGANTTSARWGLNLGDAVAEGGGNTGSNFALSRWDDAGAFLSFPLYINRDTGQWFITGSVVFNDNGGSFGVRMEGVGDANLFNLDSGNDRIGIGTNTPLTKLHVEGTIRDIAGNVRAVPILTKTAAYIIDPADVGECISITTGGVTIQAGSLTVGDAVTIFNNSGSNQTITASGVTLYFAGTASTGNRTLAQRGLGTVLCVATDVYVISGAGVS